RLVYDDAHARFASPDGVLARAPDGPETASGAMFAPVRELSPVRYEYRAADDAWIEHRPDGSRRSYGRAPDGRRARVRNALGTHAWLLVSEVDADGNDIAYTWHGPSGEVAPDDETATRLPVLAGIRWGGNRSAGLAPIFTAQIDVRDRPPWDDLLDGRTRLQDEVSAIRVSGPGGEYWRYELTQKARAGSGWRRLVAVTRRAPGETARRWAFGYSEPEVAFEPGRPLGRICTSAANPLERLYVKRTYLHKPAGFPTVATAISPPELASGHKFIDLDGDGDLDVLYHPAGIQTTASEVLPDLSATRAPLAGGGWQGADELVTWLPPGALVSAFADLDGDGDADGFTFPVAYAQGSPGAGGWPPDGEDFADVCCDGGFWNECGQVDPSPMGDGLGGGAPAGPWQPGDHILLRPPLNGLLAGDPILGGGGPIIGGGGGPIIGGGGGPIIGGGGGPIIGGGGGPITGGGGGPIDPFPDPGNVPPLSCAAIAMACYASNTMCEIGPCLGEENPPDWCRHLGPKLPEPGVSGCLGLIAGEQGTMSLTVYRNPTQPQGNARSTGLTGWPARVGHRVRVRKSNNPAEGYSATVESDFSAPIVDVDADGQADLVLLKALHLAPMRLYKFLPRVYLGDDGQFAADPLCAEGARGFSASLVKILADGKVNECFGDCIDKRLYPQHVDFTALFADVNADGLPDLVAARPPTDRLQKRWCRDGQDVHLNLGHGWRARALPPDGALDRLLNRSDRCQGIGLSDPGSNAVPMAGAALTDLDGDGRVDLVLAYTPGPPEVFLNTGAGFVSAPAWAAALPSPFALAAAKPDPKGVFAPPWQADLNRMVDVDRDGLVDVVRAGYLTRVGGQVTACQEARWFRQRGPVPDRLVRVTEPGGAWMRVDYIAPASDAARREGITSADEPMPAGLVVRRVQRAAGPDAPVETIDLRYGTYVRDVIERTPVGFAELRATFTDAPPFGAPTRTRVMVQRFDVRPLLPGLAVRHPLRGRLLEEALAVGAEAHLRRFAYSATRLGREAVRVRTVEATDTACVGERCVGTVEQRAAFDAFGEATRITRSAIGAPDTQVRTERTLRNDTNRWHLGLVTAETQRGRTRDADGRVQPDALLTRETWQYDERGRVTEEARTDLLPTELATASGLSATARTTHRYDATGLRVESRRHLAGGRSLLTTWRADTHRLYPREQTVAYTRYRGGQAVGRAAQTEAAEWDL
ncbi:MAG: VCBS repeat-containing protein, partial [Myxococcales bacterium]|nr:VCBS repeat-containing protein [Myxococcales bacterium]